MAYNDEIFIFGHHNIYSGTSERRLRITYSIPEKGTNRDTGILILVPGFGGNVDSKIYKKMRDRFADEYNLITVQCEYFGSQFMQTDYPFTYDTKELEGFLNLEDLEGIKNDPSSFLKRISNYSIGVVVDMKLNESINEFADLGFMQAIDLITSVEAMKILMEENNIEFNYDLVYGYGHSHGAYLLYLANRLSPHLFTYIFDNCAWLNPKYLLQKRKNSIYLKNALIIAEYDYYARKFYKNQEMLNLIELYKGFNNKTYIYSLIAIDDILVAHRDKAMFLQNVENTYPEIITEEKVDEVAIKSTEHGLDADFLALFKYFMTRISHHKNNHKQVKSYEINIFDTKLMVDYTDRLPIFKLQTNNINI